jgi:hypothetical protein
VIAASTCGRAEANAILPRVVLHTCLNASNTHVVRISLNVLVRAAVALRGHQISVVGFVRAMDVDPRMKKRKAYAFE